MAPQWSWPPEGAETAAARERARAVILAAMELATGGARDTASASASQDALVPQWRWPPEGPEPSAPGSAPPGARPGRTAAGPSSAHDQAFADTGGAADVVVGN